MPRPTKYAPELADAICECIADGESLRAITTREDMPAQSTVFLWLRRYAEFSEQYARAREWQADLLADEVVAIADLATAKDVQARRLQVDARKWRAGQLRPKVYGGRTSYGQSRPSDSTPLPRLTVSFVPAKPAEDPR